MQLGKPTRTASGPCTASRRACGLWLHRQTFGAASCTTSTAQTATPRGGHRSSWLNKMPRMPSDPPASTQQPLPSPSTWRPMLARESPPDLEEGAAVEDAGAVSDDSAAAVAVATKTKSGRKGASKGEDDRLLYCVFSMFLNVLCCILHPLHHCIPASAPPSSLEEGTHLPAVGRHFFCRLCTWLHYYCACTCSSTCLCTVHLFGGGCSSSSCSIPATMHPVPIGEGVGTDTTLFP